MRGIRAALGAVTTSLALLLLTGCGDNGSRSNGPDTLDPKADITKQSLTVSIWDGYSPEDLPERVKQDLGVPVKIAHHATNEEIMAKLTGGGAAGSDSGIDVAFVSGQYAQALNEAGLLEPTAPDTARGPRLTRPGSRTYAAHRTPNVGRFC
ncbi:hypothetical protein [Streptomyces sp. NPDC000851]